MDLYAIWSERNNAVRECNMAVAEKRQAMVDRDIAIRQRDAAFFDRDNARMQRDNAIARLHLKTNSMNAASNVVMHNPAESGMIHNQAESGMIHNQAESCVMHNQGESGMIHNQAESSVSVLQGVKEMLVDQKPLQKQRRHPVVNYSEIAFKPVEVPFSDVFAQSTTTTPKSAKSKKGKKAKETKTATSSSKALKPTRETKTVSSNKSSRPVRETKTVSSTKVLKPTKKISKRGTRNSNKQANVSVVNHPSSDNGTDSKSSNFEKQHASQSGLSLNDLGLDYANLPVPFCSCTGNPQSCYKWGKGGWQSACCTTTLSEYPLPQMPNKRHSRMGGRKMSGGAFTKLITRLASEGHNITTPIDLKNHWARHGTNRYIIIR